MTGLVAIAALNEVARLLTAVDLDVRFGPSVTMDDLTAGEAVVAVGFDPNSETSRAANATIDWAAIGTRSRTERGTIHITVYGRARDATVDATWDEVDAAVEVVLDRLVDERRLTRVVDIATVGAGVEVDMGLYAGDGTSPYLGLTVTIPIDYQRRISQP